MVILPSFRWFLRSALSAAVQCVFEVFEPPPRATGTLGGTSVSSELLSARCVGADARHTAVTMRVAVDADPVRAHVWRRSTGCSMPCHAMPCHAGATGRRDCDRRVDDQPRVASSSCHRTCRPTTAHCCLGRNSMLAARTGHQKRGNPPICCISPSRSGCPTSETIFPVESR